MLVPPNTRLACLLLALALVAGCRSKQATIPRQQPPLSPIAQEIQRRGYHAKESLIVSPTAWEISTFRMRTKRVSSFRADQPEPGPGNYYCRFSLLEETFDSTDDARHRLTNVHLADPEGPEMERFYLSAMRTGFRVGNVTYILQTDASAFWNEVQRFAKKLAAATDGAELTRAIIDNCRTNRCTGAAMSVSQIDSSGDAWLVVAVPVNSDGMLLRVSNDRDRRDRPLLRHSLGSRIVEPAMAPGPAVHKPASEG